MSQQINLYNPLFLKREKYFSARTMLQALGVIALALAGLNAGIFHTTVYKSVAKWDQGGIETPPQAKLAGALSILLWTVVIALGRWQAHS